MAYHSGSLNQQLSSTAIEEGNKEITAIMYADPTKRQPHLKILPEQKAMVTANRTLGFKLFSHSARAVCVKTF